MAIGVDAIWFNRILTLIQRFNPIKNTLQIPPARFIYFPNHIRRMLDLRLLLYGQFASAI